MSSPPPLRTEINGRAARIEELRFPALVNYGHFTSMQVTEGAVRGLGHHLERLDAATRELFGVALDHNRVRACIRHALGTDTTDATVRVNVFWPEADGGTPPGSAGGTPTRADRPRGTDPSLMVTVTAAAEVSPTPQHLRSVVFGRPLPHLKHTGTFGQIYHRRAAQRDGFDDALFVDRDGMVSETAVANIGFYDRGGTVVWPDAPGLPGVTMQLLDEALSGVGRRPKRRPCRLGDLADFGGAFLTSSLGICPVGRIDDLPLPVNAEVIAELTGLYRSVPVEPC
ncbi:aminotransferase class IV [Streptomyces sp. KR80]|uniref:aminotransferase class IV n=1 Tax=Streptomyces sp. KR80 TaxID=3457426 RepID=UPI003FD5BC58